MDSFLDTFFLDDTFVFTLFNTYLASDNREEFVDLISGWAPCWQAQWYFKCIAIPTDRHNRTR